MDQDASAKFMGSLTKFLQSLCNGYVEFDDGVELIGHIYLNVDAGKKSQKVNYFLNEKVCKNDNSVTFISNSFHAQSDANKGKISGKDYDGQLSDVTESVSRSSNFGLLGPRTSTHLLPAPRPVRPNVQATTKRSGSPLMGNLSQRRTQSPKKLHLLLPKLQTECSTINDMSSPQPSHDNLPSPLPAMNNRNETSSLPVNNQQDISSVDNQCDNVTSNIMSINPSPEFESFLGSLTSDGQPNSKDNFLEDDKPEPDVTFIKEEYIAEPSSCAQANLSDNTGHSGDAVKNSGLYPVMLHQNTSVFPGPSGQYPNYSTNASSTQQPVFPNTSQCDIFNPAPGTSQENLDQTAASSEKKQLRGRGKGQFPCEICNKVFRYHRTMQRHRKKCEGNYHLTCKVCSKMFYRRDNYQYHLKNVHDTDEIINDTSKSTNSNKKRLRGRGKGQFPCNICNKVFLYQRTMQRHRKKCEGNYHLTCEHCGKMFHRRDYYQQHLQRAHNTVDIFKGTFKSKFFW